MISAMRHGISVGGWLVRLREMRVGEEGRVGTRGFGWSWLLIGVGGAWSWYCIWHGGRYGRGGSVQSRNVYDDGTTGHVVRGKLQAHD